MMQEDMLPKRLPQHQKLGRRIISPSRYLGQVPTILDSIGSPSKIQALRWDKEKNQIPFRQMPILLDQEHTTRQLTASVDKESRLDHKNVLDLKQRNRFLDLVPTTTKNQQKATTATNQCIHLAKAKGTKKHKRKFLDVTPPPDLAGQYDYKGQIETHSAMKKGFSMSVRKRQTIDTNNTAPGPGAYDLTHSSYKSLKNAPSYSIGHSAKSSLAHLTTPGPLDYVVKDDLTRKKMSFVIGKEKRQTLDIKRKASIPGPGSYAKKDILGSDGPKYSITTTKHSTKISDIPGPGTYEPTLITPKDGYTVIGREKRGSDPRGNVIGPGQYDPFLHQNKPKGFTIGHDKRDNSRQKLTPGPGQYDLPSTIANLPRYNQSSSKH